MADCSSIPTLRLARVSTPMGTLTIGSLFRSVGARERDRAGVVLGDPGARGIDPFGPALGLLEFGHRAERGIRSIERAHEPDGARLEVREHDATDHCPVLREAADQLDAYFAGVRTGFDLLLDLPGTEFQRRVWQALCAIPCGRTRSYGDIAQTLGAPGAARAVGLANGANRVAIVVPCHRVIDSNGRLHGYGGGLDRKRWLLDHERARTGGEGTLFAAASSVGGAA